MHACLPCVCGSLGEVILICLCVLCVHYYNNMILIIINLLSLVFINYYLTMMDDDIYSWKQ